MSFLLKLQLSSFAHEYKGIAVDACRTPVIEGIGKLGITARHQDGLRRARVSELFIPPPFAAQGGFWNTHGTFGGMVNKHGPAGDAAETIARWTNTPLSLKNSTQSLSAMPISCGILVVQPDRITATRERHHAVVVRIGGVNAPFAVRGDVIHQSCPGLQLAISGFHRAWCDRGAAYRWAGVHPIADNCSWSR